MEHLIALLGGISAKLYDDLHDNDMITPYTQEILKGTQWMSLTLLSHSDFNFTAINYLINVLNAINNNEAWKYPYEKSLLILYPLLLIISFHTMSTFSAYDGLCILALISVMSLEPLLITEEYSFRKLLMRVFISISVFIGISIGIYFGISNSILKILIYSLGYAVVSSCFQAYFLYKDTFIKESKDKEIQPTEEESKK